MNWYSKYQKEWKQIIETVSNELKISTTMIEKDIIQSMFLCNLSKSDLPFVFKGGTSLSKGYQLINRFSEDLDLSASRKLSQSERKESKKIIKQVGDSLGLTLTNEKDVFSNHLYNKYVFNYHSLFNDFPLEILVETSFFLVAYPYNNIQIQNYVSEYCSINNIKLPIPFDASNFNMNVQTLERTYVDKIFAVCDYRIQDLQERDSRHLYDIAKLSGKVQFNNDLKVLFNKVRKDRLALKNNPSSQDQYNIHSLLIDICNNNFYKNDYNSITIKLLYEDYPYDKALKNGLKKLIDSKILI